MLMKLLTEARKGRENLRAKRAKYDGQRPAGPKNSSSAKRDNFFRPEDGYLQLVITYNYLLVVKINIFD